MKRERRREGGKKFAQVRKRQHGDGEVKQSS